MISGINMSETIDFILPTDTENPTTWKLGMIPSGVLAHILSVDKERPIQGSIKLVQLGLRGWTNFSGIEFESEKKEVGGQLVDFVSIDLVNKIPLSAVMAISEAIVKLNHLSDTERKN